MLRKIITLSKTRGKTPLETIQEWKKKNPEYKNVATSYAGRLDPMAEGKLLVLIGDECKKQEKYTKLDKEYVVEILFGIGTDTGDVLGFPKVAENTQTVQDPVKNVSLKNVLDAERGTHLQNYPIFSSKTVHGKPLFLYALTNTLSTIEIPTHEETIYSISLMSDTQISLDELEAKITEGLAEVPRSTEPSKVLGADFRQDAIRTAWHALFSEIRAKHVIVTAEFRIAKLRVTCGSGAYMRTLAQRIGESLGTNACALSINRTKIGTYAKVGFFGLWIRQF